MGNLHLVTGFAGEPHVTSADQGSLFEALIRKGQFVMEAGANFAASIVTNNKIRVSDGELMIQGRHVKLTPGAYVDLTIENGAQGYLRYDLIVARYTRNSVNGIEECSLVVLKGTPAESNPSNPQYTTGNLNAEGALQHDFPLYRVPISGLNIGEIEPLFGPQKPVFDSMLRLTGGTMSGNIAMGGKKITGLGNPTADGDAVPLKYAIENFAPSGYGLNNDFKTTENAADFDGFITTGWYRYVNNSGQNLVPGFMTYYAICRVDSFAEDSYVVQTLYPWSYSGCALQRSRNIGVWSEWEWINPPMVAGTEYRTTERYKGDAVYKKVDAEGNILWRKDGDSRWHLLASADYIADATIEE